MKYFTITREKRNRYIADQVLAYEEQAMRGEINISTFERVSENLPGVGLVDKRLEDERDIYQRTIHMLAALRAQIKEEDLVNTIKIIMDERKEAETADTK